MNISTFNINKFQGPYSNPCAKGGYYNPRNIDFKTPIKNLCSRYLENEDDRDSEVSRQEFLEQLRYMGIDQSFVYPELENFICTDYLEVVDSTLNNVKGE